MIYIYVEFKKSFLCKSAFPGRSSSRVPQGNTGPGVRRRRGCSMMPYTSGLHQLKCTPTSAFPVSPAGGVAQSMRGHRQAFPTPRGSGKSDPKGGVARLPGGQGGVPPRLRYAGDAPATPEGTGKATRRAAFRGFRTSSRAACGARTPRRNALSVPSITIGWYV